MSIAPVVVAASVKHTATIIFLHGLGDNGHGWSSAISSIRGPHTKVICPTAPTMPVSLNAGFQMPSWFDLKTLDANGPEDEEGIRKATEGIHALINSEIEAGIDASRIILGGFSQGGALALYSGMVYPKKLGGIMALSCWLPLHKSFPAAVVGENAQVPIIQCHGDCDPIVQYKWGQMTASYLKSFATDVEFKTYRGMMHSSSEEEMRDLRAFLQKYIPPM
ncbi:hypothetical protein RUM43_013502 [Polyplax serrata]|uniref:palmitoyl-protein hydrolase n=1 Tax=Polyplax serrata TaxID=468196 RepID=A0AAN8P577_POLSC